ncbi:uncharacterized protein F5891DRAFT_1180486 [Suillus fuscotomentosus]|uniref:Uncharacterized protein n=1 Tax=Suillus fuscotomentosus TaxID=1912939 RepID=A0AAD4EMJ0_9AGAM|nr:uncharacterized protein F5891DRAFT_1180486 [Suillus fuscotomentosus]KAG1908920.1 hypothetical protein F5891DRAFT_1180486 [Suillus fuscotomentosus]
MSATNNTPVSVPDRRILHSMSSTPQESGSLTNHSSLFTLIIINTAQLTNPFYWKGRQIEIADQWMPKKRRNERSAPFSVKIVRKSYYNPSNLQDNDGLYGWRTIITKSLSRPFVLFVHEPIVQLLDVNSRSLSVFLTTIPPIFQGDWLGRAKTTNMVYIHLKNKNGGVATPEFRLSGMVPGSLLHPIGCLIVGWTSEVHTHWIAVDIGMALVGAGIILSFQCIQTYILECFQLHAASAIAAVALLRSLAGFGFPLFAPAMYDALGFGKGNTVLAVAAIVLGCPAYVFLPYPSVVTLGSNTCRPWIFWHYGERIRNSSRHAH